MSRPPLAFADKLENSGCITVGLYALSRPATEYDTPRSRRGDAGAPSLWQRIPFELGERCDQRGDQLPLRTMQIELQPTGHSRLRARFPPLPDRWRASLVTLANLVEQVGPQHTQRPDPSRSARLHGGVPIRIKT